MLSLTLCLWPPPPRALTSLRSLSLGVKVMEEKLAALEAKCRILDNNELVRHRRPVSQGRAHTSKSPERHTSARPGQSGGNSKSPDGRGHVPTTHHGHPPTGHRGSSPTRHHKRHTQKLDLAEVRRFFLSSCDSSPVAPGLLLC